MRCAQHVSKQKNYVEIWDVCQVLEELDAMQLAAMNDPSGATGRIFACSTTAKAEDALSKLHTAAVRARKALDAHNEDKPVVAYVYLDLLFGGNFPAR